MPEGCHRKFKFSRESWHSACTSKCSMTHGTVVLLGDLSGDSPALAQLVPEFGWSIVTAAGVDQLRELSGGSNVVAVLFDANSLGLSWQHALSTLRNAAPQALLIPCHRLSEAVDWPELADAGAFHALALPLHASEVRQSLGFVWSARLRRTANVVPISRSESRVTSCSCGQPHCECSATRKFAKESVA